MLPVTNIGMKIGTWRNITSFLVETPASPDVIRQAIVREFGSIAPEESPEKGENIEWSLDQKIISVLVSNWTADNNKTRITYVPRNIYSDRIDHNNLKFNDKMHNKIDVHLSLNTFSPSVWMQLGGLLGEMYGTGSQQYLWCMEYYEQFQLLFLDKYNLVP